LIRDSRGKAGADPLPLCEVEGQERSGP